MDAHQFIASHSTLLPALTITAAYISYGLVEKKLTQNSLVEVIATFLSAISIITGIKTFFLILMNNTLPDPLNMEESEATYALIGCVALVWIGASELIKKFRDLK